MDEKYNQQSVTIIKKQVKNISLKVKPNTQVVITVPLHIDDNHIQSILTKRRCWIDKKIEYFKNIPIAIKKEYVNGENYKFLGKNYRLRVYQSNCEKIILQRNFLEIYTKNSHDYNLKEKLVDAWYHSQAQSYFQSIVDDYRYLVKCKINKLRIRKMKTRWGSCNPIKKFINLNSELIKKPKICIQYVVFHEMAHLMHPNHDASFYNYLSTYMPDWKRRKQLLENF